MKRNPPKAPAPPTDMGTAVASLADALKDIAAVWLVDICRQESRYSVTGFAGAAENAVKAFGLIRERM